MRSERYDVGVLPESELDAPVLPDDPVDMQAGILPTPHMPAVDWPCGVCSNLNSKQRESCYRCGSTYADSMIAMPCAELCVRRVPPTCTLSVVQSALQAAVPSVQVLDALADGTSNAVFFRVASVEVATQILVQCHCELSVPTDDRGSLQSCVLQFSLNPRLAAEQNDESSRRQTSLERTEETLATAKVPKELWPHRWRPDIAFATADEKKAYLAMMSTHWAHLSEEQRRFYDEEVKKTLMSAAQPATIAAQTVPQSAATGSRISAGSLADSKAGVGSGDTAAPAGSSTLSKAGKSSLALDALKKRLAERKNALKKTDTSVNSGNGVGAAVNAVVASESIPAPTADSLLPNAAEVTNSASSGAEAGEYVTARAELWLFNGFPVPPQYQEMSSVPTSLHLAEVPLNICERILAPSLLNLLKQQGS